MSVKELKEILAKYDDDDKVVLDGGSFDWGDYAKLYVICDGKEELIKEVEYPIGL